MPRFPLALACVALFPLHSAYPAPSKDLAVILKDHLTLRRSLGLDSGYDDLPALKKVRVAVLDHGFAGIGPIGGGIGDQRYLPKSTELVARYDKLPNAPALYPNDAHGRHMAQIVWAVTGYSEEGPQLKLYNARGHENFLAAVKEAIAWGAHIILFSHNWEFFGDFGGHGFIDEAVREATDQRILWINAAGNYGGQVYNGPAKLAEERDFVLLSRADGTTGKFLRFRNHTDENDVTIRLAWGDRESLDTGTDRDLDLHLYLDPKPGEVGFRTLVASSTDRQVMKDPQKGETIFSHEEIFRTLRGYPDRDYLIAVSRHGGDFLARDRIRVTVTGTKQPDGSSGQPVPALAFTDATKGGEIMVPGDGSGLTVGDLTGQSAQGPTRDGREKPEIRLARNHVTFSDNKGFYGTSYAAAYVAGLAAVLMAKDDRLRAHHLASFSAPRTRASLKEAGWKAPNAYGGVAYYPALSTALQKDFASDYLWRESKNGVPEVLVFKPLHQFSSDGIAVAARASPEATLFVRNAVHTAYRSVQGPGYWQRTKARDVVVTPARREYFYEWNQLVYRDYPAVTKRVPGKEYWVPGEYSTQSYQIPYLQFCFSPTAELDAGKAPCGEALGTGSWIRVESVDPTARQWRTPASTALPKLLEAR